MADLSNTEIQIFDSQPPSSPSGNDIKYVNENEYQKFQNTRYEDTVVLDSPLVETQLENLGFDTELVDDSDGGVENMSNGSMCEYGEDVVLDSEDEGVDGSKVVSVVNGVGGGKAGRRFRGSVLDLQKGQLCSPRKEAENMAVDSDDSDRELGGAGNKVFSVDNVGAKVRSQPPVCDQNFARLNYIGSEEPGESTQANALGFVDHFLSLNNVEFSPGVGPRKTVREKSHPVSSAKGPQSLAKRIKLGTPIVKIGTFEWTDSDEHRGGDFFSKRMEASFDFGGCRQKSVTKHQKVSEMKIENNSVKELDAKITGHELETSAIERDPNLDMFDIGFNTQVAAEAMEALAYAPPACCSYDDDYQGAQNALNHSPRGLTEDKVHLGPSSFQESACSDFGDIARIPKRKRSARKFRRRSSISTEQHPKNRELDLELATTKKVKRGKSSTERQLNCRNSAKTNESSGSGLDKPTKQRKADRASERTNLKEFEINTSSSILIEHISLGEGQPKGKCINLSTVGHQTRQLMSWGKLERTKDQSDSPGGRKNDGGILQYRRKKCIDLSPVGHQTRQWMSRGKLERTKDQSDNPGGRKNDGGILQYRRKKCIDLSPVGHQTRQWMSRGKLERTKDQSDNPGGRKNDGGILQYRRKKCIDFSPVGHQTRRWMSWGKLERTKDQSDNPGERKNDGGIHQYRRKRSSLVADPFKVLGAGCLNSSGETRESKLNPQDQSGLAVTAMACDLTLVPWRYPRGKRTRRNVGNHLNGANNSYSPLEMIDRKDRNVHSVTSQKRSEGDDNMKGKAQSSVCTSPLWHSSENDSGRSLLEHNSEKTGSAGPISNCESAVINTRMLPLGLDRARASMESGKVDEVETTSFADGAEKNCKFGVLSNKTIEPSSSESTITFSSNKSIYVASSNRMYYDYHRKPCNKNLPKSSFLRELIRLGVPKSIPDFTWKDLRRRKDMAHVQVLFSQHLDDDIIKQQKKILARLGISNASCSKDATHFIADKFARTKNMLEAIALGKPVVTHLWLESCGQASCFIDEKNYILRDTKKEKEMGFSMPVSLARASQHPLLKGQRVLITPNVKPDKETITSLVVAVQGQPVKQSQISAAKDEKILDNLLILSCEEDHAVFRPFLGKGAAVYSSELLLNGIVIQKLEYERHKLFRNQVKRNRSST